jgi:hypothetical protein
MGETIEQRCRHLGIDEDVRPFAESQIGRDDDREDGLLISTEK